MASTAAQTQQRAQRRVQRKIAKSQKYFDYTLLFVVLFLIGFGLVMIYSTSSYSSAIKEGDSLFYLKKQALWSAAGFVAMFFITRFDYHVWTKFLFFAYIVTIILQVLVFVPRIGVEANGSRRWIKIGFQIQPSEIAKIVLIMFLSYVASITINQLKDIWGIIKVMAIALPIIGLVIISNLSTAIVLSAITFVIVFVASDKYKPFILIVGLVVCFGLLGLMMQGYRMDRIDAWLNVETHPNAYQTRQALYAIGSGGLFGKGLGHSIQKLNYLPEAHNDMIFSIICEELGVFGAVAVILLFILLLWRCMVIANNAPDLYGALIVVGVMTHIGMQVLINIAVSTNSMPNTGIPMPFISYGGSSLVFLLCEIGVVLAVSKQIKFKQEGALKE